MNYFEKVGAHHVGCVGDDGGDVSDGGDVEDIAMTYLVNCQFTGT